MASFTLHNVIADYTIQRSDVIGPGWVCQTLDEAQALMIELQSTRKDLCNFEIKSTTYGG